LAAAAACRESAQDDPVAAAGPAGLIGQLNHPLGWC
jgi:hypothetical protein